MLISRTGVEAEFVLDCVPVSSIVASLARQGIEAEFEDYNHETREHWKVTTDSSCGYELVSPILDKHSARSINGALRGITLGGGQINDRCGLHVHVELPPDQRHFEAGLRVAAFYHEVYGDLITPLLDQRRHDNRYCRIMEDVDTFLAEVRSDRYMAVNLQSLSRQPTVEFRQLQGTLDARLVYAWMHLVDQLTHESLQPEPSLDQLVRRLEYLAPVDAYDVYHSRGLV